MILFYEVPTKLFSKIGKRDYKLSNSKTVLDETPFQTAGPFLHIGCLPNAINIKGIFDTDLGVKPFAKKDYDKFITITGSVFDGDGKALDDIMLESWQSDENGVYSPECGFARFVPDSLTKKFNLYTCLLYTSPSPRDRTRSRMPSSA